MRGAEPRSFALRSACTALHAAIALACAGAAHASRLESRAELSEANARAQQTAPPAIDLSRARVFRDIRAAEIAEDIAALGTIERDVAASDEWVSRRIALARRAIDARAKNASERELADAERALIDERQRLAKDIAVEASSAARDAARELHLECAEDACLRLLAIGGADGAIAIGLPDRAQRVRAVEVVAILTQLRPLLESTLSADAAIATDAAALRAHTCIGLGKLAAADLATLDSEAARGRKTPNAGESSHTARTARDEARALLERAAKSELAIPAPLEATIALARARAGAATGAERDALLARAAKASDAVLAFTAEFERWRVGGMRGNAPWPARTPLPLVVLAATAEARARRGSLDADLKLVAAPFRRALQVAFDETATNAAARDRRVQAVAAALAARFDESLVDLVNAAGAAELPDDLLALAVLSQPEESRGAMLRARREHAMRAAESPLFAPFFAPVVARQLALDGDSDGAANILESLLSARADLAQAPEIAAALVATRETRATTATGEAALDRALALAIEKLPRDPARNGWILARADLALFPRFSAPDAPRAAQILLSLPNDGPVKPLRELRAIEADLARLPARGAVEPAKDLGRRASILDATLAIEASRNAEARRATDRIALVEAELALREGRATEALRAASRALERPVRDQRTADRAVQLVARAASTGEQAFEADAVLAAFAGESAIVRDALAEPIADTAARVETALIAGDTARAGRTARERLAPMTRLALLAPTPADAALERAAALAALATGDRDTAVRRSKAAVTAAGTTSPELRASRWLLAEALRLPAGREAARDDLPRDRAEAFAILRELAPVAADGAARDRYWWAAQVALLEILADEPARRGDALARLNRLAAQDAAFGSVGLEVRVRELRQKLDAESSR
jgi:hypothetical protein